MMDTIQDPLIDSTAQEKTLQRQYKLQQIKESIYRFFYNIWPSVQSTLAFVFYHTFRIVRGGIRTAIQQLKQV